MCADRQEVETPETTYREGRAMNQLAKQTLADLRPNAEIKCLHCEQNKPQTGSAKFRAHHVCADCVVKLQAKGSEK